MRTNTYQDILKKYWGYDSFRGIQQDIIESIGSGHDTLGLMPTGGGKSITFQVPALATEGTCIVITPLIALMKDQVVHLKEKGICAAAIYSGMQKEEIMTVLDNTVFGAVKLLYVSPERLGTEAFQTKIRHAKISFITVDEAHCISQWGYDFRPAYLQIERVRQLLPDVPVLALTATATPEVVDDIQEKLGFKEKRVFRMSFERKNLAYVVRYTSDKQGELIHILNSVKGSAIVYTRSRQRTKDVAEMLNKEGLSATFYHAGLDNALKDSRQKSWQNDEVRVIVATNAFGMGIDKPDVRIVIHVDCPDSIEAYFQEAGRAGRDGCKAYAVLLYNDNDKSKLKKRVVDTFPEKDYIRDVYEHLAYFYQIGVGSGYHASFEFSMDKFCKIYKFFPIQVNSALNLLDRAGYIEYHEEQDNSARLMFILSRDDLYRLRNNSPEEDKLIIALLRSYGGLFCDYHFIDESFLASQTGLTTHEVYQALKQLNQKRILSFIPEKCIPTIRYTQRREESEHLRFPKEIYEERKKQFEERIDAMIAYASNDTICRSRQLLAYFGEKKANDCNQCDVCLNHKNESQSVMEQKDAEQKILELLSDKKPHNHIDIKALQLPTDILDAAIKSLIDKEMINQQDGKIFL